VNSKKRRKGKNKTKQKKARAEQNKKQNETQSEFSGVSPSSDVSAKKGIGKLIHPVSLLD
jgi:hypothetical protein